MNSIKERAIKLKLLNGNKITITNMSNKVNKNYTFGCIIFYLFQNNKKLRDQLFKNAISKLNYDQLEQLLPNLKNNNNNNNKPITKINKRNSNISLTNRQYNELIVGLNNNTGLAQEVFTSMMEEKVTSINIRGGSNSYQELMFGLSCIHEYIRIILGNDVVDFYSIDDNLDPDYGTELLSAILNDIQLTSQTTGKNKTVTVQTMGRTLTKTETKTETDYTFLTRPKNNTQSAVPVKKSKKDMEVLLSNNGIMLLVQTREIINKNSKKLWIGTIKLQHKELNSNNTNTYTMTVNYLAPNNKNKNNMDIKIGGPSLNMVIPGTWKALGTAFYHNFQTSIPEDVTLPHTDALMVSILLTLGLMNLSI